MMFTEKKRVAAKAASITAMGSQRFFFRMGRAMLMTTSKMTAATPASIPANGRSSRHKQYFQKLVPDVLRAASAADYERMVLEAVRQYGRGISR